MSWYRKPKVPIRKRAKKESYAWIHITVPKIVKDKSAAFCKQFNKEDLYIEKDSPDKYGIEDKAHITVKYGLVENDPEEVKKALKNTKSGPVNLGKTSIFDTNNDYDVLKVEVISKDLHRVHKDASELANVDEYPTYNPHVTLAYFKKGKADQYVGSDDFKDVSFNFSEVIFEDDQDIATTIKLK